MQVDNGVANRTEDPWVERCVPPRAEKAKRDAGGLLKTANGQPEDYDLVILGSGTGAKLLAWTFASRGQRVAAIERKYVGGACPNIACLPSKNIIHTAQIAQYVRNSEEFGISIEGD